MRDVKVRKIKVSPWKTQTKKSKGEVATANSAYLNSTPYLTKSKICTICGTSSNIVSM